MQGGQSWDPFRPVIDSQPSPVSSEVAPALGTGAAYTRRSLSKLVLQNRASYAKASQGKDGRKQGVPQQRLRPAPLAKEAVCPAQPSAAQAVHISGATQGQRTPPSAAGRGPHTAGKGPAAVARPQPQLSNSGPAKAPVRQLQRTWQRQKQADPSRAKQGTLETVKGTAQTVSSTRFSVSASQQHASTAQGQPQSPRFARRRANQLVRLSSASPARRPSVFLCSGAQRLYLACKHLQLDQSGLASCLQVVISHSIAIAAGSGMRTLVLPITRSTTPVALPTRTRVAATPRAALPASLSLGGGTACPLFLRNCDLMSYWSCPIRKPPSCRYAGSCSGIRLW